MTPNDSDSDIGIGSPVYDPEALGYGVVVTVDDGVASVNVSDPSGAFRADIPVVRLEPVDAEQVPSYTALEQRAFADHR